MANEETKNLAKKFAAPVISNISENNSLRETSNNLNIPMLVYKAGEAILFDESYLADFQQAFIILIVLPFGALLILMFCIRETYGKSSKESIILNLNVIKG